MTLNTDPTIVPPMPVPTAIRISTMRDGDGDNWVVVRVDRPSGNDFLFIPPDHVPKIVEDLEAMMVKARSGLLLPPPINGHSFGTGR